MRFQRNERSVTPVLGNLLLVAVVIIISITLVTLSFAFLEQTGAPTAEASFDYEQTPVGLKLTPEALGTDVIVKLNQKEIETISADRAGQSVLLPTAPGDTVTVVSKDDDRSVLVSEEIDERDEVGDFIAYYTFESDSGTEVTDRSGNGNDGQRKGNTQWISDGSGAGLDFDGTSGTYVDVGNLQAVGPDSVEELTIAMKYEIDSGSNIQNLIEHQDSNFAWFIETNDPHGDPHDMEFNIGYQKPQSGSIEAKDIPGGETQVIVGTFDGNEMVFYRNGTRIGTESLQRDVALGEVILGADSDPSSVGQNLDGRIYETRLYYAAFSEAEVDRITTAMR
jgi:FlaG/FlaF family flagellin (archaellin)